MKKLGSIVMVLVIVALIGSLFATAALAKSPGGPGAGEGQHGQGDGSHGVCVDEDGDGVCDNFVDEDGDGVCDNCQGDGQWVDEDGDGVCDNAPADGTGNQYRSKGASQRNRRGARP